MQKNLCKIMLAKKSLHCYSLSMDTEHETSEAAAGESAAASADTAERHDRVLDLTSLKALAHPLRVQILDELSTYGPATASGLAAKLGESSGATSYHLRQLEKNGFVAEDTERGVGRERWWRRVPGGISVDITGYPADSAYSQASEVVLQEWQRRRDLLLHDFLSRGDRMLTREWLESSVVSTANLKLTIDQMRELVSEQMAVVDRYAELYRDQDIPGSRPVQMHLNVFPVVDGIEAPPASDGPDSAPGDVSGQGKN